MWSVYAWVVCLQDHLYYFSWAINAIHDCLVNPRRMREGYSSRSVCLCVFLSVCYRASCYIPQLYDESQVSLGFLCWSQRMYCVDFVEHALFESSGDTCWPPLPSSLLDQLLTNKRDSNGFLSRKLVCRTNDSSYNSTGSSLGTANFNNASWLV